MLGHVCTDGWVCEEHPDRGWQHGGCDGGGEPCPICNTNVPAALPDGWLSSARVEPTPMADFALRPFDAYRGPEKLFDVWTMTKGNLTLVCSLETHVLGWQLRLTAGDQFIRSQVCRTPIETLDMWEAWEAEAVEKGWVRA